MLLAHGKYRRKKGYVCGQVEDELLLDILEESAMQIYAGIQARMDNQTELDAVRVMLEDSACIWTGTGFVAADCALISLDHDCTPYLHCVPAVAAPYKRLLGFLGVGATLTSCYLQAWSSLHTDWVNIFVGYAGSGCSHGWSCDTCSARLGKRAGSTGSQPGTAVLGSPAGKELGTAEGRGWFHT